MEWQPIETHDLHRDGCRILAWNGREVFIAQWGYIEPSYDAYPAWFKDGAPWDYEFTLGMAQEPTHWMPLPAPPSSAASPPEPCGEGPPQA